MKLPHRGCRHHWTNIHRSYTSPLNQGVKLENVHDMEFLAQVAFGFTTSTFECEVCGDEKVTRAPGDQTGEAV